MIILFNENEKLFTSLGIGILNDAISCTVIEEKNGGFELEMEYPINGSHYEDISIRKIIFTKPNMYDNPQPFRIYQITKPINGIVTIAAEHISYDMSGYTVKPFSGTDLQDVLDKIKSNSVIECPFTIHIDESKLNTQKTMEIKHPYNMRALMAGDEGSILDIYEGDYKFDKYDIYLLDNRGQDRGIIISYGKNMTDLEQELNSEKIFTGVFPFYYATITETTTAQTLVYEEVHVVPGKTSFEYDWLTRTEGGDPFIPILEDVAIKIISEGDYENQVVVFKRSTITEVYITPNGTELTYDFLTLTENGDELTPEEGIIYTVIEEGSYIGNSYIWIASTSQYKLYGGKGFYKIPDPIPDPIIPRVTTESTEEEVYVDITSIEGNEDGIIYLEGHENDDPQKILTLDLSSEFSEEPTAAVLKAKAEDYIANNNLRQITENLTVSFIKLADTPEYQKFASLEEVYLGDIVTVKFEVLGVESQLQVITTQYDVLTNKYLEIELGEKTTDLGDSALIKGDNISSLTNDAQYTDKITVTRLIATTITAELITAKNANLSEAQIEELETINIRATGIIEASQADIDSLVAQLLTAEDADIKGALKAGSIEVAGHITAYSGVIGGCEIDEDGNLIVSSSITIGEIWDQDALIGYNFEVQEDGTVSINKGSIDIGYGAFVVDIDGNVTISGGSINIEDSFIVDEFGNVTAESIIINGGSISIGAIYDDEDPNTIIGYNFYVDEFGEVTAYSVHINGGSITIGDNFYVDEDGILQVKGIQISDGVIDINAGEFYVDQSGVVTAKSINIEEAYAGYINTNILKASDITMSRLYMSDENVYIERITTESAPESQEVTFTAAAVLTGLRETNIPNDLVVINVSVQSDEVLYYDHTISVSFTYKNMTSGKLSFGTADVLIYAGYSSGNTNVYVSVPTTTNIQILSAAPFPNKVTETRQTGSEDKIIVSIYGVEYDLITGIQTGGTVNTLKIELSNTEPTDPNIDTYWYDYS